MTKRETATVDQLLAKMEQMEALLAQLGVTLPGEQAEQKERPDFIGFGTPKHLAFLGLVVVENLDEAKEDGFTVLKGRKSGTHYRLVDEMGAIIMLRPMDPDKSVPLILRQKINTFEAGPPEPPPNAPLIFRPPGMQLILPTA